MSRIGDRVQSLLSDRGWSQAELARRAGCTRAAISNICRGSDPSLTLLRRLAAELGVAESELLDGTEPAAADEPTAA